MGEGAVSYRVAVLPGDGIGRRWRYARGREAIRAHLEQALRPSGVD